MGIGVAPRRLIEILLIFRDRPVNRNSINGKQLALVTVNQLKAARALLGWSQSDLAKYSGVSEPTIARLESLGGGLGGRPETGQKIRSALEKGGIEFIDENGGGAGVRLRKPQASKKK